MPYQVQGGSTGLPPIQFNTMSADPFGSPMGYSQNVNAATGSAAATPQPQVTQASMDSQGGSYASAGLALSIGGAVTSAIGSYYAAESQKMQLKSQASAADFAARMADINARRAEVDAQNILAAGQKEIAMRTQQMTQAQATVAASTAGRGLVGGVGSVAEVQQGMELAKKVDTMTIRTNTLRQAQAARTAAVNERNQALLGRVSAENLRKSAGTIIPAVGASGQLMGASGQLLSSYGRFYQPSR